MAFAAAVATLGVGGGIWRIHQPRLSIGCFLAAAMVLLPVLFTYGAVRRESPRLLLAGLATRFVFFAAILVLVTTSWVDSGGVWWIAGVSIGSIAFAALPFALGWLAGRHDRPA